MKSNFINTSLIKHLAAVLLMGSFIACKKQKQDNPSAGPVPVNITTVQKQEVAFYDNYPGTVVALNEVELRSEVSGFLTGIHFKEGEFVRKGRKLYEIDQSRYRASYGQARANMDVAGANVERAKRNFERYTMLSERDAIAKQKLEDAQTDLKNAGLELESAKEGLVKAQTDLNHSLITAPFDGTIGFSRVKLGALITPGQTLLNTISSDDPIGVDFVINEKELGQFQQLAKPGAAVDSAFRITLPDRTEYTLNGKIQVIDRAIDPQTGTVRVRLVFQNTEKLLKPGLSCDVHVLNKSTDNQIVIPLKSLLEQMSEYFVFVVDSQKVRQTKVTLGTQFADKVVVTGGLTEGQQIVTDGLQKIHHGSLISEDTAGSTGEKSGSANR